MSKRCQIVKKMWNVKKSNSWTMGEVYKKKLVKNTFCGHFEGFWWPSYVTSKLTSICTNLIMSIYFLWTSSIVTFWHLTSLWQLDIILSIWHLFDILTSHLNHLSPSQGYFWWPSYVMSKFTSLCVNLIMSIHFLWTSSIVYVFDFLTFDIFLTTWHLFDNLTSFWHLDI